MPRFRAGGRRQQKRCICIGFCPSRLRELRLCGGTVGSEAFRNAMTAPITLTTDFGLDDWFVGAMKGVILSLHPAARIVDITHGIPPGDVRSGAFALAAACGFFPRGTLHVAVVDPGVGSERPAIVVAAGGWQFLGPDNGVLAPA